MGMEPALAVNTNFTSFISKLDSSTCSTSVWLLLWLCQQFPHIIHDCKQNKMFEPNVM